MPRIAALLPHRALLAPLVLAAAACGPAGEGFGLAPNLRLLPGTDTSHTIDFYQFWAIGTAREIEPGLAPPYGAPQATRRALERHFDAEPDPGARAVHRFRMGEFEPFGSPLLYLAFAPLPQEYGTAAGLYRALQWLALAAGVLLLARGAGFSIPIAVGCTLAAACAYRPFGDDLYTGNLGALQLGVLAGLLAAAARLPARGAERAAGALLAAAAGLALLKANAAPAAAGLALHLAVRLGARGFGRACAWAAPLVAALLVAPCLWLGSASVWGDWIALVFTEEPARLADYAVARGNTSTPRVLVEWLGVAPAAGAAAVALALAASLAPLARRLPADPYLMVSLGVVAMLAVAPLVWFHYFVLALLPGLWLLAPSPAGPAPRACAAAALLLYAAPFLPLAPRGLAPALYATWSFTWIPLWAGLLLRGRAAAR